MWRAQRWPLLLFVGQKLLYNYKKCMVSFKFQTLNLSSVEKFRAICFTVISLVNQTLTCDGLGSSSWTTIFHVTNMDYSLISIALKFWDLIGASLSELHTSVTGLRKCVCIYACTFVCLDRPLTVNFKWAHSNISRWLHVMSTPTATCTSAKPKLWERGWRATARLQVRCERERERRQLKWMRWQHRQQLKVARYPGFSRSTNLESKLIILRTANGSRLPKQTVC